MITQNNLFLKAFTQLAVLIVIVISMVALTERETLAIPLEPILDQMGLRMVEGLLSNDSSEAVSPASESFKDTQHESDSASEAPQEASSHPTSPTYPPSIYPSTSSQSYPAYPSTFPPGYPTYTPPTYPSAYPLRAYPPGYIPYLPQVYPPTYSQTYPSPIYLLPTSMPPAYPSSAPPSGQPSMPLIINNINR